MALSTTQTTTDDESDTSIESSEENTLEALSRLDDNSRGEWVRCVCTEVNPDDLRFVFETVHHRGIEKSFDVPRVYDGSDVQSFFERVGYSAETASVMEGDTFWMKMDDERVADSPPNRRDSAKDSMRALLKGDIDVDETVGNMVFYTGVIVLWPITTTYIGYVMADEEESWFVGVLSAILLWTLMGLLTALAYELLLPLLPLP